MNQKLIWIAEQNNFWLWSWVFFPICQYPKLNNFWETKRACVFSSEEVRKDSTEEDKEREGSF